jgi:hypothetical protein
LAVMVSCEHDHEFRLCTYSWDPTRDPAQEDLDDRLAPGGSLRGWDREVLEGSHRRGEGRDRRGRRPEGVSWVRLFHSSWGLALHGRLSWARLVHLDLARSNSAAGSHSGGHHAPGSSCHRIAAVRPRSLVRSHCRNRHIHSHGRLDTGRIAEVVVVAEAEASGHRDRDRDRDHPHRRVARRGQGRHRIRHCMPSGPAFRTAK